MKNVLLLEPISDEAFQLLTSRANVFEAESPNSGSVIAEKEIIHAIITRGKGKVDKAILSLCPQLEVAARCGVGLDNFEIEAATAQGVKIVNAPGSNADTVAEHTLALMLNLQRDIFRSLDAVKKYNWNYRNSYSGDEIRGKTLGILGMGNIGKKVANLANAFGMKVFYHSTSDQFLPYEYLPLEELLKVSDILSLHVPLNQHTRYLLNKDAIAMMKSGALIINTARGEIIEESALIEGLQSGKLGGYAADIPNGPENAMLKMGNVLITPHAASLTASTFNEMCVITVNNTLDLIYGNPVEEKFIFNLKALKAV